MTLQAINEDLLDVGIQALMNYTGDRKPRMVRRVQCGCGAHAELKFRPTDSPEWLIREFVKKGWKVGRKNGKAACPECARNWNDSRAALDDEMKSAILS